MTQVLQNTYTAALYYCIISIVKCHKLSNTAKILWNRDLSDIPSIGWILHVWISGSLVLFTTSCYSDNNVVPIAAL